MKIQVNKTSTGHSAKSVSLELTNREFELLTVLFGSLSPWERAPVLNKAYLYLFNGIKIEPTTGSELDDAFGAATYRRMANLIEEEILPTVIKIVEFVYDKQSGEVAKWRNLHVTGETNEYIEGLENGSIFKKFLKSRITGGKIITVG